MFATYSQLLNLISFCNDFFFFFFGQWHGLIFHGVMLNFIKRQWKI